MLIVDFADDVVTQLTLMPRQTYVAASDDTLLKLGLGQVLGSLMTTSTTRGYSSTQP